MLGKKSGLSYCDVRERYEHFRARCTQDKPKIFVFNKLTEKEKKKEKGCTEPLYGKKSKCIIKIVPQEEKIDTFQMDSKCLKKKRRLTIYFVLHQMLQYYSLLFHFLLYQPY